MSQQLNSFEWEITEFQDKQKKSAYFIMRFLYVGLILLFFIPGLAFAVIIISAIMIVNFSQTRVSNNGRSAPVEKYKIDEGGIYVENLRTDKRMQYFWKDLAFYCSYNKANQLLGSFLGSRIGDDFTVIDKNNSKIELRAGINDSERVSLALSCKLKFKLLPQSASYSNDRSFRMTSILDVGSMQPKVMNLQGPVGKFKGGDDKNGFMNRDEFRNKA